MLLFLGDWVPEQEQTSIEVNTKDQMVFLNLEGPILTDTSSYKRSLKAGPYIYSASLPDIHDAKGVYCSLANNHINDFGWSAVKVTRSRLQEAGYYSVGAGENEEAARKPLVLTVNDRRYAMFSFCEVQAGRATSVQPGVATIGPWIYKAVSRIRAQVDTIILSVHAGNEMLPWPSPARQDLYRSYVDAGADIVYGHHSHVPQGIEIYNGKLIIYGLGNFLGSLERYRHFIVQHSYGLRIPDPQNISEYTLEPYQFQKREDRTIVAEVNGAEVEEYHAVVQAPLSDRRLLEGLWQEAALWLFDKYGRDSLALPPTGEPRFFGSGERIKSMIRRFRRRYTGTTQAKKQSQIIWYHMFACVSHQTMMETALGLLCGELIDLRTPESRELVSIWLPKTLLK